MTRTQKVSLSFRRSVNRLQATPKKDRGNSASRRQWNELLAPYMNMWKDNHEMDLMVRFKTGRLLHFLFGIVSPNRPNHDEALLIELAQDLGTCVSELLCMRAFAESFETLEEFTKVHPEVNTWSAVKGLLAARGREVTHTATSPEPAQKLEGVADNRIPVQETLTVFKNFPK